MEHLLQQVRPPIDDYERLLVNVFSVIPNVAAIWMREVQNLTPCTLAHPHQPSEQCPGRAAKKWTRTVWVQFTRRSAGDVQRVYQLYNELSLRTIDRPFNLELHYTVDELPPSAVAPSCIFRRGSGRI